MDEWCCIYDATPREDRRVFAPPCTVTTLTQNARSCVSSRPFDWKIYAKPTCVRRRCVYDARYSSPHSPHWYFESKAEQILYIGIDEFARWLCHCFLRYSLYHKSGCVCVLVWVYRGVSEYSLSVLPWFICGVQCAR